MNIDSTALKSLAQNIIARRDTARANDERTKREFIMTNAEAIQVQLAAIRAIAPAVYELRKAGIRGINDFFTEGIHHRLGFSDRRRGLIGCCGGGCSGLSLFVDFETGDFVVSSWYDESGKNEIDQSELAAKYWADYDIRGKIERIAKGLTQFAEEVAMKITAMSR